MGYLFQNRKERTFKTDKRTRTKEWMLGMRIWTRHIVPFIPNLIRLKRCAKRGYHNYRIRLSEQGYYFYQCVTCGYLYKERKLLEILLQLENEGKLGTGVSKSEIMKKLHGEELIEEPRYKGLNIGRDYHNLFIEKLMRRL